MSSSRFLQQLAFKLRQPQWIAVILSLGFHGALFAAGPSFSSLNMNALGGNIPEQERRQVPLIELTPEEQSRLPDFSGSSYSLFSGESDSLELFPPSGSSLPLNPLPNSSRLSDPSLRPKPSPGSPSTGLGVAPYTPPRRPSISFLPQRTPLSPFPSSPSLPRDILIPSLGETPSTPAETVPSTPTATVEPDPFAGPTASDLARSAPSGDQEDDLNAPLNAANGEGEGETPADPLQAQLDALAYRPENTTEEEAEANLAAWQSSLEERLPGQLDTASEPIEMQVSYVQRPCLDPTPTDALLGLVALPTEAGDDLQLFPRVLKSTGYPFLDQEVVFSLIDLQDQRESSESEAKAESSEAEAEAELEAALPPLEPAVLYQVQVDVDYDQETCIDRESLLEGIKQNQETAPKPNSTNGSGAASSSNQSEPGATPEEAEAPASEPSPAPEATPAEETTPQSETTDMPGAEALREPVE